MVISTKWDNVIKGALVSAIVVSNRRKKTG